MNIFGTENPDNQGKVVTRDQFDVWPGYGHGDPGQTKAPDQVFDLLNALPPDQCVVCGQPVAHTHRNNQTGYAHVLPSNHQPQMDYMRADRQVAQTSGVKVPLFTNFARP